MPIVLRGRMTILIETDRECHLDDIRMLQLHSTVVSRVCDSNVIIMVYCELYVYVGYTMPCEH